MFTHVLRSPDSAGGGAPSSSSAPLAIGAIPIGGADGQHMDLRARFAGLIVGSGPLSDHLVRSMLADCCAFLRQLAMVTGAVIETIGLGQVRQIIAAELPVPSGIIGEDGRLSEVETPARADHRTGPRGRKHPVITLLQMALQGIRLMLQITAGTNPEALDKAPLEERRQREVLKEQEKSFRALLKG